MTDKEIESLIAGGSLDALVHQRVFRKRVELRKGRKIGTKRSIADGDVDVYGKDYYIDPDDKTMYLHATDGFTGMIPQYSTNIADAWKVVDKIGMCIDYQTNTVVVSKNERILATTLNNTPLAVWIAALKTTEEGWWMKCPMK